MLTSATFTGLIQLKEQDAMKRLRILLTAIAFAAFAAAGVSGPAGAATVPAAPIHWATHAAAASDQYLPADGNVQPNAGCGVELHVFKIWETTCDGTYATTACTPGHQGYMPFVPSYASNGCEFRVWIYTGPNRTGNNLCINPRTSDGYLHQAYVWFWVSDNQADC